MPDLPSQAADPCYDPGVDPDAVTAITEQRVALASCRQKHSSLVDFYLDVKGRIEHD